MNNNHNTIERPHDNEVTDLTNIPTSPEESEIGTENPYTVRRESVQPRRTIVKARKRSSFSYPNQAPLIPYPTTYIEIDENDIRQLSNRRSEPSSRLSTPTLQNFSIASPELPSESSIATPTSTELRANPFYQSTRQQVQYFNLEQQLRQHQATASKSSFWSA